MDIGFPVGGGEGGVAVGSGGADGLGGERRRRPRGVLRQLQRRGSEVLEGGGLGRTVLPPIRHGRRAAKRSEHRNICNTDSLTNSPRD